MDSVLDIREYLDPSQTLIMRSTVYPTLCRQLSKKLEGISIAYCPERIVQGYAMKEIPELPQIISGIDEKIIFDEPQPSHALVLAWNLKDMIIPKLREKGFRGKFIIPVPTPHVVS